MQNNYKYQGNFSETDADIGWNDFELRNYDAQIGRWVQQDPYDEFPSPYVGMGNDPILNDDPSGGFLDLSPVATIAVSTLGGAIIGEGVDLISGGDGGKGALIGAAIGLGAGSGSLTGYFYGISDVIQFASKSTYFNNLMNNAGINNNNFKKEIKFSSKNDELGTYTVGREIYLQRNVSLRKNVIGLSHELTNRILSPKYTTAYLDFIVKHTNAEQYAEIRAHIEDESLYSQFKVAKELKLRRLLSKSEHKILMQYRRGKINDAGLKKAIEAWTDTDINPKSGERIIDIYIKQAKELRSLWDKKDDVIPPPKD